MLYTRIEKLKTPSTFFILSLGLIFSSFISTKNGADKEQILSKNDMIKVKHYTDAVDNYMRGLNEKNLELILSLYADNATVEDPVGSKIVSGKVALREFYTGAVRIELTVMRTGPVRIAGVEVAFPFQLLMNDADGTPMKTDIIDVFRFDEAGKIVSMRAFWGPSNRKQGSE